MGGNPQAINEYKNCVEINYTLGKGGTKKISNF